MLGGPCEATRCGGLLGWQDELVASVAQTDPLEFTQLLLTLIDEGRRTATYKLAVLLALIDCSAVASDAHGRAPAQIATRALARRVIELYWPQVRPYASEGSNRLRQSSQPRAITIDAVAALRSAVPGAPTLDVAERLAAKATVECLEVVELNLVRMPLGKLQRPVEFNQVDNPNYPRFLYDDASFHEGVTHRRLKDDPLSVILAPGVGESLVSLAGLLRPLIELHWTRDVARFNRISLVEDRLREFLFGSSRVALTSVRAGLLDAQTGRCFYCAAKMSGDQVDVDHFVPWSRIPNDGLANLVLADRRCNNQKRDNYASLGLVVKWAERPVQALSEIADDANWPLRLSESLGIARSLYGHLPGGTRLWASPGAFELLDRQSLSDVLPTLIA